MKALLTTGGGIETGGKVGIGTFGGGKFRKKVSPIPVLRGLVPASESEERFGKYTDLCLLSLNPPFDGGGGKLMGPALEAVT